jgi:hypothetical protein
VVLAIGLPALLAAAVAVVALRNGTAPPEAAPPATTVPAALELPQVAAPQAQSRSCAGLLGVLPAELASAGTTLARRSLAEPAPPGAAAWGEDAGQVTLRCGLDQPKELTRTSPLLEVSGVRWLQLPGEGLSTWVAVDRDVYVGLTFADDAGTGPLQDISAAITATLPAQRVQPGG